MREANPLTHVESLDLQRTPEHLIVLGGGYTGLELGHALRRLGSRVTIIDLGTQLAASEDADVSEAILALFRNEGIDVAFETRVVRVDGRSGSGVRIQVQRGNDLRTIEGTEIPVAVGRTPNTGGIGLDKRESRSLNGDTSASMTAWKRLRPTSGRWENARAVLTRKTLRSEPAGASVSPFPIWRAQPEPGGVSCTTRNASFGE